MHPSDLKIFRSLFVFWNYQWFILSVHFSDLAQFSWKQYLFKTVTVAFLHLKGLNHEAYEKLQPEEWKWPHKRNLYCFIFFLQKFNVQQILLSFEILPLFTQQRSALLRFKHTNPSNNSYFAFFRGKETWRVDAHRLNTSRSAAAVYRFTIGWFILPIWGILLTP